MAKSPKRKPTLKQFRTMLQTDRAARAKYIKDAATAFKALGIDVTPEIMKRFEQDAISGFTALRPILVG